MNGSQEYLMCDDAPIVNPIILTEKKRRRLKKSIFYVVCSICGKEFTANHNQSRYCSDECRLVVYHRSQDKYKSSHKEEVLEYQRNNYERDKEKIIARTTAYHKTERGREAQKIGDKHNKEKFPEAIKARSIVGKLIRTGKIEKQPCEKCGNEKVHGHHDDYSKPEEVRWLCCRCHAAYHKELRKILRMENRNKSAPAAPNPVTEPDW